MGEPKQGEIVKVSGTRRRIVRSIGGALLAGLISYVFQGILAAWGILDPVAAIVGEWLAVNISPPLLGWIIALLIALTLYGLLLWHVWGGRTRYVDRNHYHQDFQAQTKPVPSLQAELIRADVSDRRWELGQYSSPTDPPGIDSIVDALTNGMHAQIGSRPLPPDVAAIVEAKRRNLSKTVAAKLSAGERWTPLDQAILYLANGSKWGLEQDPNDPHFSVNLSIQLQDALACGDLTARGRRFHLLKGGIKEPPLYPLTPLGKGFWAQARIDAYWPLAGSAQRIASHRVENVVRKGDHEGMHDVLINQRQLEALWPARASAVDAPRVPFASLRDIAMEYGLNLDHRDPGASNVALEVEGELKEAAANYRLPVWGRPYNGLVRDNDPLIPIPANHFNEYSFRHGALNHVMRNDQTSTTTMSLLVAGKEGLEGVTFYDLHVSTLAARAIIKRIADERAAR